MKKQPEMLWHPKEYVTTPRPPYVAVYPDYWWVVNLNDEVALYTTYASFDRPVEHPQCNQDKRIAEHIAKSFDVPTAVVQIPMAFVRINIQDYI